MKAEIKYLTNNEILVEITSECAVDENTLSQLGEIMDRNVFNATMATSTSKNGDVATIHSTQIVFSKK